MQTPKKLPETVQHFLKLFLPPKISSTAGGGQICNWRKEKERSTTTNHRQQPTTTTKDCHQLELLQKKAMSQGPTKKETSYDAFSKVDEIVSKPVLGSDGANS